MVKAYYAYEKGGDCATIVFAENRSQAKMIAQTCDCCEDAQYIDIRVNRIPEADKLYKGLSEIDWYDDETDNWWNYQCQYNTEEICIATIGSAVDTEK